MESNMIHEKIGGEKREFLLRISSSFLFIPIAILLFYVSSRVFAFICWGTYSIIVYEIFFQKNKKKVPLKILAASICALGIYSFVFCRECYGLYGYVFLICITCSTDIGAYSFGKIFRGPKLCPQISPQKTWAGFWGGIFLANVVFLCLKKVFFSFSPAGFYLQELIDNWGVVQIIILASIGGDLIESSFKRKIGVKDMSEWFPGHGGVLDRLDSLILASIVFAAMYLII
ncbi:MAG: phosphatidate cytidylyltransferase [Holosporaceae bacterium]|jgi:phosphatidate cytidylyltransferase|nr:phosphatidate cytidylyltransferase [Holosporaceae bacterium]